MRTYILISNYFNNNYNNNNFCIITKIIFIKLQSNHTYYENCIVSASSSVSMYDIRVGVMLRATMKTLAYEIILWGHICKFVLLYFSKLLITILVLLLCFLTLDFLPWSNSDRYMRQKCFFF